MYRGIFPTQVGPNGLMIATELRHLIKPQKMLAARRSTEKKNAGPHRAISPAAAPKIAVCVPHHTEAGLVRTRDGRD
jgi:hypothetical protein